MKTKILAFATLALLASSAIAATPTYLYRLYSPGVKAPVAAAGSILPTGSNVFATWNPADSDAHIALSNGNLTANGSLNFYSARATQGKSSGKWYWELTQTGSNSDWMGGIADSAFLLSNYLGTTTESWGYYPHGGGYIYKDWSGTTAVSGVSFTTTTVNGTTLMFALDLDNHALYLGKDGVWSNGGDPAAGAALTGAVIYGITGTIFPAVTVYSSNSATANFGATPFKYSVPAGYHAGVFQ